MGGRLCSPNNTGTPGFSDLPTALVRNENSFEVLRAHLSAKNKAEYLLNKIVCNPPN